MDKGFKMNGLFYGLINKVYDSLGADGLFVVSISILLVAFLLTIFLFVRRSAKSEINRSWFVFICLGLTLIELGIELIFGGFGYSIVTLGVSFIFSSVILYMPKKENKFTIEQLDFARKISKRVDDNDKRDNLFKENTESKEREVVTIRTQEKPIVENSDCNKELDFSHVKNVLKRMEYYSISQSDKRQVKDLETALYQAENGEMTESIKVKINDGLGALLKIMSKYGI